MNLPNTLTLLRILLVPAVLTAILYRYWPVALVLFAVAALSDFLDGLLARLLHQKTRLGAYLDPLADKLLVCSCFPALAARADLPTWLAVLVVARDLFVVLGAGILYLLSAERQFLPSRWGKTATALQLLTVCLFLFSQIVPLHPVLLQALVVATGLVTLCSGAAYLGSGIRALPPEPGGPADRSGP